VTVKQTHDRRSAAAATLVLYSAMTIVAALIRLQNPASVPESCISLTILQPHGGPSAPGTAPAPGTGRKPGSGSAHAESATQQRKLSREDAALTVAVPSDQENDRPGTGQKASSRSLDSFAVGPLSNVVNRERALHVLDSMLRTHPEFHESIFREMMAGSGFIRDTVPHPRESIMYLLTKMKFLSKWEYERWRAGGQFGGYDPVHGWDGRAQKLGPQINIKQLYEFIRKLSSGE
jgi:hypothetical protein